MGATQRLLELAESFRNYTERLLDSGIKSLGDGSAARVFQHPTLKNVAVKVFVRDDAYMSFIKWCELNKGNVYIPKILDIAQRDSKEVLKGPAGSGGKSRVYTFVFTEKLQPIKTRTVNQFLSEFAKAYSDHKGTGGKFRSAPTNLRRIDTWDFQKLAETTTDSDLFAISTFLSKTKYTLDLNTWNVMQRGSSQLVFVDPLIK